MKPTPPKWYSKLVYSNLQHNGSVIADNVNRTKPSSKELSNIFDEHIAENSIALMDSLRSYNFFKSLTSYAVVDVNQKENKIMFILNTVNSLHSFIKFAYSHYRGVATKYINRYNTLFSVAFRCTNELKETLFFFLIHYRSKLLLARCE